MKQNCRTPGGQRIQDSIRASSNVSYVNSTCIETYIEGPVGSVLHSKSNLKLIQSAFSRDGVVIFFEDAADSQYGSAD